MLDALWIVGMNTQIRIQNCGLQIEKKKKSQKQNKKQTKKCNLNKK